MTYVPILTGSAQTSNTFSTTLLEYEIYNNTSSCVDVSAFATLVVTVHTDQDSAKNGLVVSFSPDKSIWHDVLNQTILKNECSSFTIGVCDRYVRVSYANGGSLANVKVTTLNRVSSSAEVPLTGVTDMQRPKRIRTTTTGDISVHVKNPVTAFNELIVASHEPEFQYDFIEGINPEKMDIELHGSGTVTPLDGMAVVASGTETNSVAFVHSRRCVRYHAGQGSLFRFTAMFPNTGTSGNQQMIGIGNYCSGLYFGYKDGIFGVRRLAGGTLATATIKLLSGLNSGDITVVLDGVQHTIIVEKKITPSVHQTSAEITASIIANHNFTTSYPGWIANAIGPTVTFVCTIAESITPTVFISGNGINTSSAAYTNGVEPTVGTSNNYEDQFVPQSQWNGDTLDGTNSSKNPSGILLNTTYGNIYQISMQYLAFGKVVYSLLIGDNYIDVHVIDFRNSSTVRNVKTPNFYFQMYAKNTSSTITTSVAAANCIGIIQGKRPDLGVHRNYSYMLPFGNDNKLQEDPICIFAIRPTQVYYNSTYDVATGDPTPSKYSAGTISLLSLTLGNDEGNAIVVSGRSGKLTYDHSTTNWKHTYVQPSTNSVATIFNRQQYTGTLDVIDGGVEHFAIMVAANSSMELDLRKYHILLGNQSSFAVSAYSPNGKMNGTRWCVALQWIEEQ